MFKILYSIKIYFKPYYINQE